LRSGEEGVNATDRRRITTWMTELEGDLSKTTSWLVARRYLSPTRQAAREVAAARRWP
jgi:hypothetical protein